MFGFSNVLIVVKDKSFARYTSIHDSTADNFQVPFLALERSTLYYDIFKGTLGDIRLQYEKGEKQNYYQGNFKGLTVSFRLGFSFDLPIRFENKVFRYLINLKIRFFQKLYEKHWHYTTKKFNTKKDSGIFLPVTFIKIDLPKSIISFLLNYGKIFLFLILRSEKNYNPNITSPYLKVTSIVLLKYTDKNLDYIDKLFEEEQVCLISAGDELRREHAFF